MKLADQSARMPASFCPHCGKLLDAAAFVSKSGKFGYPRPGNLTVCIDCSGWLVFRDDLSLRRMDALDIRDLDPETHLRLMRISSAVKALKQQAGPS